MYLKRLYQYNKLLALVIILFVLAQLINNIRQDIAISPLYSYGMYSEIISPTPNYNIPEVFVNGRQLQTKDFSPQEWDNIMFPVSKFYEQKKWNKDIWQTDIRRIIPYADSSKFFNDISEEEFKVWHKNHLAFLLDRKIDSLQIVFTHYVFDGNVLKKLNSQSAEK